MSNLCRKAWPELFISQKQSSCSYYSINFATSVTEGSEKQADKRDSWPLFRNNYVLGISSQCKCRLVILK